MEKDRNQLEDDLRTRLKLRARENVRLIKIEEEVVFLQKELDEKLQNFSDKIILEKGGSR